jgi:hypothetical protein
MVLRITPEGTDSVSTTRHPGRGGDALVQESCDTLEAFWSSRTQH